MRRTHGLLVDSVAFTKSWAKDGYTWALSADLVGDRRAEYTAHLRPGKKVHTPLLPRP